ncbi:quinone-dependent dihydroorotate dehydrogenase [Suttonella ornithocola]|uniref:Dihydroorotate dehydrogenase (quinone) n=1 Tax=Suttonella ornithocola TaxID=279832 RepID=A0A380MTU7_9GAMM|nr:quinone-dependent dihydroorotate dehydrogenase [Suttonella ornithocola]SUO95624.1 Dihydroorotate dehydrogenase (quinone) [Suttonella ornithocola]
MSLYAFLRPMLFGLAPEAAHELTLKTLAKMPNLAPSCAYQEPVALMGLTFPNRLGLAAGLDKNALAIPAFARMGFGFIEVGTITPRAQPGNPKPRLFRLPEQEAIINRMGFNNEGAERVCQRVAKARAQLKGTLIGINLGKNKDTPNEQALKDYRSAMDIAYAHADYLTINLSSPNTQGLRELQHGAALKQLLKGLKKAQTENAQKHSKYVPLVVKLSPDNTMNELDLTLVSLAAAQVDGIIATNTTIDKTAVSDHRYGNEQGGLSGKPLTEKTTNIIKHIRDRLPNMPLIASGGVMTANDYQAKLTAGADLVQLYTGLIYQGPRLIQDCFQSTMQKL